MSYLIGIDVEAISDIKNIYTKHHKFVNKILTAKEIYQLKKRKKKSFYTYLAGRFSAKESYSKATGYGISKHAAFKEIEILDDEKGAPQIKIFGNSRISGMKNCLVSISHKTKLNLVMSEILVEIEKNKNINNIVS